MIRTILISLILIASSSLEAQDWLTDFEAAKEQASNDHRAIIMVFQGSDWCAPCIRLSREVWETETFREFAPVHFVMLQVDFPRQKKNALAPELQEQNSTLAEKYNPNGYFPFVVVLDENGKVLGETGYQKMTPDEYIKHLSSFIP